jgi:hypothetical protein
MMMTTTLFYSSLDMAAAAKKTAKFGGTFFASFGGR